MCGIAGIIEKDNKPVDTRLLQAMSESLAMRGPDDQGIWQKGSVGLVHRRLSIIDLSPLGKQPMISADGRYVITFNGEIYNYLELRDSLEKGGVVFRSQSDTEVLLHLYAKRGRGMLHELRGMFAFAIWDKDKRELFFARDRLGQKPFFYRTDEGSFRFASDIRALRHKGDTVDWEAVRLFFGLQYVPAPRTGYREIRCLPKGSYGVYSEKGIELNAYSVFDRSNKVTVSFEEATSEVKRLLEQSVRYRLIADVPVGLFLSGGMDSASIAFLAASQTKKPLHTFTMGFSSSDFDERATAESIAKKVGAVHHAFEASPARMLEVADQVIATYAVPYADSSALPTYLLAGETAGAVKTVMTGDGGDELFGGYRRYTYFQYGRKLKRLKMLLPATALARAASSLKHDPRYERFAEMLTGLRHSYGLGYAKLFTGSYFYEDTLASLLQPDFFTSTKSVSADRFITEQYQETLGLEGALDFDLNSYLPDDLNVKMDRATMAHSLEARSPFQDHELVEYVSSLPFEFLLNGKNQKPLLREAMRDIVPDEVFERPKKGFQVPLAEWFRGPLKQAFEERCVTSDTKLTRVMSPERAREYLERNSRGEDHGNRLWMLYSLSTWLNQL